MKRFITSLSFLLCICLVLLSSPGFATADTLSDSSTAIIPTISQDIYGIAPAHLFPFIYSDDSSFAFFRDIIGPCGCKPGLLYVKNFNTNEITQLWEEPVSEFTETADYVYFITVDNKIIQTDYFGNNSKILYSSSSPLSSIIHYDSIIYFLDNCNIMSYSLCTNSIDTLLHQDGITSIFPCHGNNLILKSNEAQYIYNTISHSLTSVASTDDVDTLINGDITSNNNTVELLPFSYSTLATAAENNDVIFPLSEFSTSPYFTYGKVKCDHTSSATRKCRYYKNANECMGFAMYASEQYAHLPTSGSFYRASGDYVTYKNNSEYLMFQSSTAVRLFFQRLTKGAYVRLCAYPKAEDTNKDGSHSLVYVSASSSSVTIYDSNRIGACKIAYQSRDYATMLGSYPYVFEYVSHHFTKKAQSYSYTYHKIGCANCVGYLLSSHTFTTSNNQTVCSACGYIQPIEGIS